MPSERIQKRIDRLLDQAEEAADRREWAIVAESARMVLRLDTENEDAMSFLEMVEEADTQPQLISPSDEPASPTSEPSPSIDQPTTFANGRYTVSRFLGEGGKKKVYLAHDNTLDRDVAFALIKTEGLDDTSRERVTREAQAMGRMGTHPCIMPIYDLGEELDANGIAQPFMVQPLMGGGDVEELIEDSGGPLPLEDALRIATQTAQGLVFAHGKGIVHRDLKPGNVWMDEDGAAKIGDFGLAVATDRSRLTVEKMMVGTVNYMPPEQATGGEVTPKADLYSLGAMLYEMSTGRVPFMGDDDIAVISQHVNTPPVAPSWHNAAIPKTLDSLILRMMAKDPSERPESAEEVLTALSSVDLSAVDESEEKQGSLDSMAGGVFVGRHREMDQLKAGFEEVLSGKGRMVTLVGEPGIGKTRTAQELATYASMRGASVLWGRSYESGGAPPYWPWVQAIRSHVAATESETLRNQLSSTAPVVAEVVPDVKAKLPDTPAPTPIEDPESARFRLFDSVSTFLKNTASSTPLVLMLEDLHWADKPSLMLLEFVARELANSRIMIVGNYRDMELNRRHPLSVTLGDLSRERLFERVVLRGLQKHDVQRFIEIAAGITPPPALVDTVFKQTEGNPLFVTETVRLLIQEGDITSGSSSKGGTTSWEIRIPEGVREVIGRRLDRLSERCNEVLTIAAVIGRQFRFDVLKMLMEDTTDGQLLDAMDEALSARIIEELPDEVGFYQFTHAQMQETLVGELSHTRAVRMHAQIAEALEEHYGDEAEGHAAELVEHFAEAETVLGTEKLVKYSLAAGEFALRARAHEEALQHFERGLAVRTKAPLDLVLADLWFGQGRAQAQVLGRLDVDTTLRTIRKAFDAYRKLNRPDRQLDVGLAYFPGIRTVLGRLSILDEVMPLALPNSADHAKLLTEHAARVNWEKGDYETAKLDLNLALSIADDLDDDALKLRIYLLTGVIHNSNLNDAEANKAIDKALSITSEIQDPATEIVLGHLGGQRLRVKGDRAGANRLVSSASAIAERLRDTHLSCTVAYIESEIAMMDGDWDAVRQATDRGLGLDPKEPRLLMCRVITEYLSGNIDDGRRMLDSFEQLVGQLTEHGTITQLMFGLAAIVASRLSGHSAHLDVVAREADFAANNLSRETLVRLFGLILAGECAVIKHDAITAQKILNAELFSRARSDSVIGPQSFLLDLQALLLRTVGQLDDAIDEISTIVERNRVSDLPVPHAWTLAEYSDLLLERNAPGDHEKAIELQDEAIAIATELGMKPLLERVLAKREILKA